MIPIQAFGLATAIALLPSIVAAQEAAPIALSSFADMPDRINTAIVIDRTGTTLGVVAKVKTDRMGHPSQVDVLMPGGRRITVPAASAAYDFEAHRVIADTPVLKTAETATEPRG